ELSAESDKKRPTVQVGDPFTEKLLLEACLELMNSDCLVGIQDMGAAGLTSSSVEMAARAGNGIELELGRVPRREQGMTGYELMLSESQERMLAVVERGREAEALAVFDKWDLDAAVIGRVTDTGKIRVLDGGELLAEIPIAPLAEGLRYERPSQRPAEMDALQTLDVTSLPQPEDLGATLEQLIGSPNLASKEWVWQKYDHMVRLGTVVRPGADAAVIRILEGAPDPERAKGLALTTDCNPRFCALDPFEGARLAVAEAYRNLSTVGAEPLAITDCLNFGNPERPEVMWQLTSAIRGLGEACRALSTPVVSGNVSLYNETAGPPPQDGGAEGPVSVCAIKPTPTVGMVGLIPEARQAIGPGFAAPGGSHAIALLGKNTDEIGGSAYLQLAHRKLAGRPPRLDLALEEKVGRACRELVRAGLLASAHDCSEGGLAVALAESCLGGERPIGATVKLTQPIRPDLLLFGEAPSRIVISFSAEREAEVRALAAREGAPLELIGATGGDRLTIYGEAGLLLESPLAKLARAFAGGFRALVS
ncbi:MAG TPA: phosphoribosylformylglycinamidine synthase subunit PurL, partial [Polyangia bacterium]